jgi:thymidylate kinase
MTLFSTRNCAITTTSSNQHQATSNQQPATSMLITFSGIVGSGKSTNAKHAFKFLQDQGYPVVYIRFRFLTWRKIFQPLPAKRKHRHAHKKSAPKAQDKPLRCQPTVPLTLVRCLGYLWRMLVFRAFAQMRLRQKIAIVDRFYYDSFTHYKLASRAERIYLWILKKALPVPDLALMLIAEPKVILRRRPHYDAGYVRELYLNYTQIAREFPNLVTIKTDNLGALTVTIVQQIHHALQRCFRIRMETKLQ